MYHFRITAHVPSKSNSYRIVTRGRGAYAHSSLVKTAAIGAFEAKVREAAECLIQNRFGTPERLFPAGTAVKYSLVWHRFDRRRRDLSNTYKAIEDALNKLVWDDDSQITAQNGQIYFNAPSAEEEWIDLFIGLDPAAPTKPPTKSRNSAAKRARSSSVPATIGPMFGLIAPPNSGSVVAVLNGVTRGSSRL